MSAVAFMHSHSIIHGDIKDENIVFDDSLRIRVIDFGSARVCTSPKDDQLDYYGGTISCISPEILAGYRFCGRAFDIWCCGVLLFTMLTGESPFSSLKDIKSCNKRIPRIPLSSEAEHVIGWMLQKDPSQRRTAHQILDHHWLSDACLI